MAGSCRLLLGPRRRPGIREPAIIPKESLERCDARGNGSHTSEVNMCFLMVKKGEKRKGCITLSFLGDLDLDG